MIRNKQEGIGAIEPSELENFLASGDSSRFHVAKVNNVTDSSGRLIFVLSRRKFLSYQLFL